MTKKEFLKRFDDLMLKFSYFSYRTYTCDLVRNLCGEKIFYKYQEFIDSFLSESKFISLNLFSSDYEKESLRIFLLTQFKDECLRSKIYKEF